MTSKAKAREGEKQSKTISMTGLTTTGKSSPVTGLEWPRGFQEVRVPRFHDNSTGWWYGCLPYAPTAFTFRKYSWYSFLLEAESTPGP